MTAPKRKPENSVTDEIIRRIHLTLTDLKSGENILAFLRSTEPVFMDEVNRFISTEMSRMRFQLTETQTLYIGSVIGATYIAGFLIAREAQYQLFNGLMDIKSPIKETLSQDDIDRLIDKNRDEGKTYKEIAKTIERMLKTNTVKSKKTLPSKSFKAGKKTNGKRLNLGDLS
jgi:hypothetical protein